MAAAAPAATTSPVGSDLLAHGAFLEHLQRHEFFHDGDVARGDAADATLCPPCAPRTLAPLPSFAYWLLQPQ